MNRKLEVTKVMTHRGFNFSVTRVTKIVVKEMMKSHRRLNRKIVVR